jgi:hypothetical protein
VYKNSAIHKILNEFSGVKRTSEKKFNFGLKHADDDDDVGKR